MHFRAFNYICALFLIKGVPVSSQWFKNGHIYPIQVGQYGLSHFSKWVNAKENRKTQNQAFVVDEHSKFVHHENPTVFVKSLINGFEFNFPGFFFFFLELNKFLVQFMEFKKKFLILPKRKSYLFNKLHIRHEILEG